MKNLEQRYTADFRNRFHFRERCIIVRKLMIMDNVLLYYFNNNIIKIQNYKI
ncbi:hypothetical protein QFZ51_000935 [Chitinophaga sp. W3I9]